MIALRNSFDHHFYDEVINSIENHKVNSGIIFEEIPKMIKTINIPHLHDIDIIEGACQIKILKMDKLLSQKMGTLLSDVTASINSFFYPMKEWSLC